MPARKGQKLFVVRREEIHVQEVEVRAMNEDEARDKAACGGHRIGDPEFERVTTRDIDNWDVFQVRIVGK